MVAIWCNGCAAAGYVIVSLFIGMDKKLAKHIFFKIVIIEIVIDIVVGLECSIRPSKISIVPAIFLFLFLFSPNMSQEFK